MEDENLADSNDTMNLFRPPIIRSATATLDRSLFSLTVPTAAARITNTKNISRYRNEFGGTRELLKLERFINVRPDPDTSLAARGQKCLILKPEIKPEVVDPSTWSAFLHEAVEKDEVGVIPYTLSFDYDYWTYYEIMTSILPLNAQGEIPVGFSQVGHIAHLNLRDEYLPYKTLIASVLVDKNPGVTTVINKIDDVGTESVFRTFRYEVLAGKDEMNVEVSEGDCIFKFDYSKVYWNSRLQTEHKRLADRFKKGEVVVDVMAGVGPFAVPAGKKGVFVWANDLNPESYKALREAIKRNKVHHHVRPFCEDGHTFIHHAASSLLELTASSQNTFSIPGKPIRHSSASQKSATSKPEATATPSPFSQSQSLPTTAPRSGIDATPTPSKPPAHHTSTTLTIPSTISHFVMNLPASALSFLPSFHGLYAGHEHLFQPHTATPLPTIHVHCFSTKSKDNILESKEIAERVSRELGVKMWTREGGEQTVLEEGKGRGKVGRKGELEKENERELEEGEVRVWDVREVAPKKRMFCAEFRLPREVAFGRRREPDT